MIENSAMTREVLWCKRRKGEKRFVSVDHGWMRRRTAATTEMAYALPQTAVSCGIWQGVSCA